MESPELAARLRYLNDAAHLLATTAPATSRQLMSKCNSLIFDCELEQSESHKRQICGACGTIMTVGWATTLEIQSQRPRGKVGKALQKETRKPKKEMVYKCGACRRTTRFDIPLPAAKRKTISTGHSKAAVPIQAKTATTATVHSANSSSKKRAKARKGGLEALLANNKAVEARQSGFGLDLMDFMKKA